jgi:hypothetical protein
MSDNPSPIQIPIVFDLEAQQAAQSLSAVQKLIASTRQEVEAFANRGGLGQLAAGNLNAAVVQVDDLGATLLASEGKARLLETAIEAVGDASPSLDSLTGRLTEVQKEADAARAGLEAIPATLATSTKSAGRTGAGFADALGAAERPFAQIAGTAGFFGVAQNSAITQSLRGVSEISGSVEALGRMKETVAALKASTGSSTLALGSLGIALLALGPAISLLKDSAKDATGPFRDLADSFDRERELLEYRKQISGQTQEQIVSEIRTQEQLVAMYEGQITAAKTAIDQTDAALDNFTGDIPLVSDAITKVFDIAGFDADALKDKLPELEKNLETARQKLEALNDPLIQISIAAQQAQEAYFQQLDFEKQRLQLIESGTPEQVAQLRDAAEQEREAIYNTFADFGDAIQDQVLTAARGAGLEEELQALFRDSVAFGGDIPTQTNAYLQLAQLLGIELPESLFNTVNTFNEQVDRMNELTEVLNFLDSGDIQDAIATRDKQQQELAALNDSTKALIKSEETHAAAIDALTKANEAAIEAETKRNQQLLDDAAKTSQSLADLETRRAEALQKQREAEAEAAVVASFKAQIEAAKAVEAEQARAVKVSSLRQEAQANEVAAQQKHQQTLARQQAQFDLQQRRRQEDLADDLDEAAADRDVKSFLRIQKDGEKELDRAAEDNELRLREQKESLDDQIREIRRNAEERIRAERDSGQRRLTQSQRLEQALGEYQANAAQQRQLRQRQMEEQAYQERVTALRNHMALITRELLNGVTPLFRGGLGAIGGGLPSVPAVAGLGIGGNRPGGAGAAIAITIQQQNVGRIATPEDITRANQDLANKVVSGVNRALAGIRRS